MIQKRMTIRKAVTTDVKQMAKVHVDSWKTTYKGIVSNEYLSTLKYEEREVLWKNALAKPNFIWVAEVDNNIVGFISGGKERTESFGYDGELYAIYILQEYQRLGIGKKLVHAFTKEIHEAGFRSVLVWVLADNPSVLFYQSLNPELVGTEQIEIGNQYYKEVAYGWSDILLLVENSKKLN